ncbi:ABC transporter ATP-binding protein [Pelotomaculum terephthalicicum JT]|uniref:ABC transporter ATP-binding protein n=1 Tax=Pelotomaculum TaxID=191373 RepID=UPI0009D4A3BD|nr:MULTISPECIES: ABC transporter ATP-binding protein [Pelotomaculum]MCG9966499.1 ABC transporter ATP-binding protein [Pelotomaculum terephthalicicum JT]OPX85997.1 MAG: putative ABC transporter ATP-binding protein YbhF [Pelotomaculum sp. PtaB.Bin117]OPY60683.1 MAG: putative ABC transporter ATP-binding protein YbhF [Pelotomaculum sp. PtaU1.Bin065]
MEYVVTTCELTRTFGSFTAVDRININIRPGEIYGFLGPNGSGKTTTMRMLCGLLEPTSGSGSVLGYDLARESEKIKQKIGYMSQKFSLYDDLTVYENLVFYAGMYSIPYHERKKRVAEMIEMAWLAGREKDLPANLSGGLKQRLALGCAIISRPSILFLDEPTSGVSPTSRRMFFKIIQKLANEGTTVMVTTHFMDEAERCHNIAFISGGRLIANDTPDNLKNNVIEGCMVEVDLPDAMERIEELESLPYVKECSIHGPLLHVLLDSEGNVAVFDRYTGVKAREITPSLEDVFISLAKLQRKQES